MLDKSLICNTGYSFKHDKLNLFQLLSKNNTERSVVAMLYME